jgi:predicted GIY-YIG superfamily endonuclease
LAAEQDYIGATVDLQRRISDHNAGKSKHTAKFEPLEVDLVLRRPGYVQSPAIQEISQVTPVGHLR